MLAGKLDRRVQLLRATLVENAIGDMVPTWNVLATRWASRQDLSDAERVRAQQVGATMSTRFQIRWDATVSSLSPKDRLSCDGQVFDIRGVKEIQRRKGLEITCSLNVDGGPA